MLARIVRPDGAAVGLHRIYLETDGRKFAVDLQARAGVGFYSEDDNGNGDPDVVGRNLGVGAAITWF